MDLRQTRPPPEGGAGVSVAIGSDIDAAVLTAVVPRSPRPGRPVDDPDTPHVPGPSTGPCTGELIGGRYRIAGLIGRGGSAAVYRGVDTRLHRPVAVKIFDPSPTEPRATQRRQAEVDLLVRLDHPGLVRLLDAHIATDRAAPHEQSFLVMELVEGTSLEDRLNGGSILSPHTTADLGRQLAAALAVVHRSGVIHRDIKPGNILLDPAGTAKLADFGIARLLTAARLTITAEVVGTPRYLSPEQASGRQVGPATDIYSFGLVLLECLTGSPAFPGPAAECAMTRLVRHPALPTFLPPAWTTLLRSMTDLDPGQRPTASTVAAALTSLLPADHHARTATTVISADLPDPPPHPPPPPPPRSFRALVGSAAVLAVAAAAAAILWSDPATRTTDHPDSESSPPTATLASPPPTHGSAATVTTTLTRTPAEAAAPRTAPPTDSPTQVRLLILSNAPPPTPTTTITVTVTSSAPPPEPTPDPAPIPSTSTTPDTSTSTSTTDDSLTTPPDPSMTGDTTTNSSTTTPASS